MSKQNSKKPALPGSTVTMGLDIGYGVVKAVTADQVQMFPSVMGHAREIKFQQEDMARRHPGDQMTDDEGDWFVGDLALDSFHPVNCDFVEELPNEFTMGNAFRRRLAKVAIGKVMQGMWNRDIVHIRIATGLPTDHMRDAAELKASLIGQHLIKTDTAELIAHVSEVMVMPQPYGTIYANTLTETGRSTASTPIGERVSVMWEPIPLTSLWTMKESLWTSRSQSGVYTAQERIATRAIIPRRCRSKSSRKF